MQLSVQTSELLRLKLEADLPGKHIESLRDALITKNFEKFCQVVTKESNQLHAVCLDTYPPIFYMNTTSKNIANKVKALNSQKTIAAYSCDAGFHVFVFVERTNVDVVKSALLSDPKIRLEQLIETGIDSQGVEIIS